VSESLPAASQKGRLIILSAPSGAGKTSLARALIAAFDHVVVSVSHTTRSSRPGEVHGKHYYFVDHETFRAMIEADEFLEYAEVFGNFYGTSYHEAQTKLDSGHHVILDIDWQGARKVRARVPDALSIFILPPSVESLHKRLKERGQDSEAVIESRMQKAMSEMSHYGEFDRVVVNCDFDNALAELKKLVSGQQSGHDPKEIDIEKLVFIDKNVTLDG
jgi:guanylate kinase